MRFIQIGTRIINLDLVTSVEYNPEESHPGHPAAIFSSLKVNYASSAWSWETFYEGEADALWKLLKANSTVRVKNPSTAKAIAELNDLDSLIASPE